MLIIFSFGFAPVVELVTGCEFVALRVFSAVMVRSSTPPGLTGVTESSARWTTGTANALPTIEVAAKMAVKNECIAVCVIGNLAKKVQRK